MKQIQISKYVQFSKYVQLGASLADCNTIMGELTLKSCRVQGLEYFPY
jgi:hypothetical protein